MADHLLEQTLPAEKAELAAYYQRGMAARFAGNLTEDSLAAEAQALIQSGIAAPDLRDALDAAIRARCAAPVARLLDGHEVLASDVAGLAALAEYVAAGGIKASEAKERLTAGVDDRLSDLSRRLDQVARSGPATATYDAAAWRGELAGAERDRSRLVDAWVKAEAAAAYRYEQVVQTADATLHGHTLAEPRRDMHPRLADLLGADPNRPPSRDEIANLLNGQRADGADIPGKQTQRATVGLDAALGLDPARTPTWDEVAHVLAGRRADGQAVEGPSTSTARSRFLGLMGAAGGRRPNEQQTQHMMAGRMADGSELDLIAYERGVTASKARIGYIDLTFSADKSLSIAWAFAPTEAERNIIAQAHRDAVDSAMEYIAAEIGYARKGKAGRDGSEPGHVAWFSFDHYSARPTVEIARRDAQGRSYTELLTLKMAGDPQLHTHVAMPNVVLTEAGRVGAMDLDKLEGRIHEFGAYYQAHIATNLRRHGVDVMLDERTGAARLAAVPGSVRDAFAKRTRDGTEAAREYASDLGLDWDALNPERRSGLLKEGTQKHKLAKTEGMTQADREAFERAARKDDVGDFASWRRQAEVLGWTHRSVLRPNQVQPERTREARLEHAYAAALPVLDRELQRRARLDGQDLRVAAARGLVASGVTAPSDIDAVTRAFATRGVQQDGKETSLAWGEDVPLRGKARVGVTTALHEGQERELVELLRVAAADGSAALTPAAIAVAVARREALPLSEGGLRFAGAHGEAQRAVMDQIGRGGRVSVAIGVAGAGKSALLAPLVDAWRAEGRQVYGAALAWRQAEDLASAGIPASERAALAAFLRRAEKGDFPLDRDSVVVVDELGLIGTKQMLDLMRLQARHGFQLIAVGDPRQAQAIEAGPVIALVQHALGEQAVPQLLTTLRQRAQEERDTSLMFREGQAAEALAIKRRNGTAQIVAGGHREAVAHVAALWRSRMEANAGDPGFSLTVSAPTNSDARMIGAAIREQRRQMGHLGPDLVRVEAQDQAGADYALPLASGDRVRLFDRATAKFTEGTHGNIGNNGSVLEVREVADRGLMLRNAAGREGLVRWDTLRDRSSGRVRLTYGDVLTIDATQGSTSTEHINAMPAGTKATNGFKGYVAESRHRETTWLVVSDGAERQEVSARRPLGDPRPMREADVWENMARNLARQPEKPSALAFLERAKQVRRGAVRGLQAGLQPAEQHRAEGREPESLYRQAAKQRGREQAADATASIVRAAARRPAVLDRLAGLAPIVRDAVTRGMESVRPALERAQRAMQQLRALTVPSSAREAAQQARATPRARPSR